MCKIDERCVQNSLTYYTEKILSNLISAYKKSYSSNQVLLRLRKTGKNPETLKILRLLFLSIYKAFDCIPHDLLAAKLHGNGLSEDATTFVHSYLKYRENKV